MAIYEAKPLINFYDRNPFVSMLRKTYHEIYDTSHRYTRDSLRSVYINITISVLCVIMYMIIGDDYMTYIINGFILSLVLVTTLFDISFIKKYIFNSIEMDKFTNLSNLVLEEIMNINEEDMVNSIKDLSYLRGKIDANYNISKYTRRMQFSMNIIFNTILLVLALF